MQATRLIISDATKTLVGMVRVAFADIVAPFKRMAQANTAVTVKPITRVELWAMSRSIFQFCVRLAVIAGYLTVMYYLFGIFYKRLTALPIFSDSISQRLFGGDVFAALLSVLMAAAVCMFAAMFSAWIESCYVRASAKQQKNDTLEQMNTGHAGSIYSPQPLEIDENREQ